MARKGQKYNKYTSEFRTKIIEEIKQKKLLNSSKTM